MKSLMQRLKIARDYHQTAGDTVTVPDFLARLDLARNGYDSKDLDSVVDAVSSLCERVENEGEGNERLFGLRCSTEILSTLASTILAFASLIASSLGNSSSADSICAPVGQMAQRFCALNQGESPLAQMCLNAK